MDNKRLVTVMVLSMGLITGWIFFRAHLERTHPEWFATQEPAAPAVDPVSPAVSSAATGPASTQGATTNTTAAVGGLRAVGGEAQSVILGHTAFDPAGNAEYPVGLQIDPRGGALASVTLNRFRQQVGTNDPYIFQKPYSIGPSQLSHALATRSVTVNGVQIDLAAVNWKLTEQTPSTATYAVEIQSDGAPLLIVEKRYQVQPKADKSLGYEVLVTHAFRNVGGQPVVVKPVLNGPVVPPVENDKDLPEVALGFTEERELVLEHHAGTGFAPDDAPQSLKHEKNLPIMWAGLVSAYFDAIVRPLTADPAASPIGDVVAQALAARNQQGQEFLALTYDFKDLTIPAGQTVNLPLAVYFGPRQRAVLNEPYYATFPLNYDATLVLSGGICGICTFQWLINLLVWMLKGFHMVFRDWGLAIIGLVVVVRLLLHPITKRAQINMSRMSEMGPEMERLKKKYGDDKDALNKAMMSYYKEKGMTPILGCLPMFLQMPIWIALWSSLQSTFELRHASFLWGFTWIDDLSQPDRLVSLPYSFNLFFLQFDALNLLPILLGVVFFLQQKMQPKPVAMTPEQEQQQKMMMWMMPFIFPLFLYSGPSGLNLYILTSTAIGIWESKRVRDHIKRLRDAQAAGPVIVDAEETPRGQRKKEKEQAAEPEKKGGVAGWIANLQRQVDQIQKDAQKQNKKGNR